MGFKLEHITKQESRTVNQIDLQNILQKEIHLFGSPLNNKIKEEFYSELSLLLNAGIPLKESLDLIKNSFKKKSVKKIIEQIAESVISGKSLSRALQYHKTFTEYEYYSIEIGEETGNLAKIAGQLGVYFSKKNEQRKTIIGALTYPCIILFTAVLVVVFMLQFVVPMFEDIFKQQNIELPKITQIIIEISKFVDTNGFLLLITILILFTLRLVFNKKSWYQKYKDQLLLKIPVLGTFLKTLYLSQFTQAVALLTASKVPLVHSIGLVKKIINFYPLNNALLMVESDLIKGKPLSDCLESSKFFGDKLVALTKVAEETNQNEFIFERLNFQYNSEIQQKSKLLSTLLEPFIIMIVGILVGVILIAMYLPMFRLSSVLG